MYETVIYAHMKTFRFTGTPALYIECDVRMCHGKCPVMPCDWREGGGHGVRRRRSAGNITALEEDVREKRALGSVEAGEQGLPGNFSESLNLFQSIQVLANEEEERAFRNETESSESLVTTTFAAVDADWAPADLTTHVPGVLVDEADFCFSSLLFTCAVAVVSALLLLSGLSISLLCARVRRQDKGGSETARDVVHTLRSPRSYGRIKTTRQKTKKSQNVLMMCSHLFCFRSGRSIRSEYVHSAQARIP